MLIHRILSAIAAAALGAAVVMALPGFSPAVEAGTLALPIHQTFPLAQVGEALATMRANRHFGKIAITM